MTENENEATIKTPRGDYAAWGGDVTVEQARALFQEKYGVAPTFAWQHNIILAGPIPEGEMNDG